MKSGMKSGEGDGLVFMARLDEEDDEEDMGFSGGGRNRENGGTL